MIAAFIMIVLLIVGLVIYNSLAWGLVLHKFWSWFVLPIFPDLPVLEYWQAVGLMLVIGLFHGVQVSPKETNEAGTAVNVLVGPWLTLIIGWFIGTLFIF